MSLKSRALPKLSMRRFAMLAMTPLVAIGLLTSCGGSKTPHEMPPPEVGVVTVTAESLPVISEFPGRLDAFRTAEVRARATGILLKRVYEEGSDVKEGDVLFQIDPAPLQA